MEPRAAPEAPADCPDLKALGPDELEAFFVALGEPKYRGRQVFRWLFGRGATTFEEMTDLGRDLREKLTRTACLRSAALGAVRTARDGTAKALVQLPSGRAVEAVLIPDADDEDDVRRLTVCVSSQVGCAMGCSFCATGRMGFQQNLTSGEIFDQVWLLNALALERFGRQITNIVFMGMGEPMLNYDAVVRAVRILGRPDGMGLAPRRITISTVGLARHIRRLADEELRCGLAVSLHAPTDEQRSRIMPVNRAPSTDLKALKEAIRYYTLRTGQPVTYEYCMFDGFNDSAEDARRLAAIAGWARCKVNLIMYNSIGDLDFRRTPEDRLDAFIRILVDRGVRVTVRRSRGQDIEAACGQLAAREAAPELA